MKKIFSILGSLLLVTAVKAQTVVKKETVNPGSSQTTGSATPLKDPKADRVDPKKKRRPSWRQKEPLRMQK
ncbi:hypothetical protein [Pedobacter sp. UC225_65]|uniref:hypothetical protein n=1 Tax=Pedobacter sp. UC225_65 TaxID=3350173 RepID=UPI003673343E